MTNACQARFVFDHWFQQCQCNLWQNRLLSWQSPAPSNVDKDGSINWLSIRIFCILQYFCVMAVMGTLGALLTTLTSLEGDDIFRILRLKDPISRHIWHIWPMKFFTFGQWNFSSEMLEYHVASFHHGQPIVTLCVADLSGYDNDGAFRAPTFFVLALFEKLRLKIKNQTLALTPGTTSHNLHKMQSKCSTGAQGKVSVILFSRCCGTLWEYTPDGRSDLLLFPVLLTCESVCKKPASTSVAAG